MKKGALALTVLIAILAVLGGTYAYLSAQASPERVVAHYLSLLRQGQVEESKALLFESGSFFPSMYQAYYLANHKGMTGFEVASGAARTSDRGFPTYTVPVKIQGPHGEKNLSFVLYQVNYREFGFPVWKIIIEQTFINFPLPFPNAQVFIEDQPVTHGEIRGGAYIVNGLFPGDYNVEIRLPDAKPLKFKVTGSQPPYPFPNPEPTEELRAQVQQALGPGATLEAIRFNRTRLEVTAVQDGLRRMHYFEKKDPQGWVLTESYDYEAWKNNPIFQSIGAWDTFQQQLDEKTGT